MSEFPHVEDQAVAESAQKAPKQKKIQQPQPPKLPDLVQKFSQLDMRCARVLTCEKAEFSDQLLIMTIDIGNGESRRFVSGISNCYQPADLLNKTVCVILNLKPKSIAGQLMSEAMLFCGEDPTVKDRFRACCVSEDVDPGTRCLIEGFDELPPPKTDTQPRKPFEKVVEVLHVTDQQMCVGEFKVVCGGKPVSCDLPDGAQIT